MTPNLGQAGATAAAPDSAHVGANCGATVSARLSFSVIILAILLCGTAAGESRGAASLTLHVAPELKVVQQSGMLQVKIRLGSGTTARLWTANDCSAAPVNSFDVHASGIYNVPLRQFSTVAAGYACVLSSDGQLRSATPLLSLP